jgi:hypothetical protein
LRKLIPAVAQKPTGSTQALYLNREGKARFIKVRGYKMGPFLIAEVRDTEGAPVKRAGWNIWHYGTGMLCTPKTFPNSREAQLVAQMVLQLSDEGKWNFNFDWRDFNAAEDVGNSSVSADSSVVGNILMKDVFKLAVRMRRMMAEGGRSYAE